MAKKLAKESTRTIVTFACDKQLLQELDEARVVDEGLAVPRSAVIEKALREWLDRHSAKKII
jgi:metal-responsive CopG/Arc/MetJ family transcriptional regulator